MTLPQAPRREGRRRRPAHFRYYPVDPGTTHYGYLAGPVMWFEMHCSDLGSKPCLHELTAGDLGCPKCEFGEPVTKGALGFYHATDLKTYMVWVDESGRDEYDKWPPFRRIKLGRERVKGAPVWAQMCVSQEPVFQSSLPERKVAADLTDSLLRMWKMPDLEWWYRHTHGQSDNAVSLPEGTAVGDDGKPFSPMNQAAAKRAGARVVPSDPRTIGADLDALSPAALAARAPQPSKNGKHPPKG